jgi:uncharacterized protein YgbK (DUF1537 family)
MLHLAYFADDFTGATDALETLAQSGRRTRLFLDPPTPAQCAGLEAVGVAGLTRSLAPDAMEAVLRPAFAALRTLNPRHVYYKVCSTFDSSPTVGSIGRAIEVGRAVFGGGVTPVVVAAPALGRYCAFGNLFARYGIGSDGPIYRLDRHPATSKHVVTPMTEADLRLHLAAQTTLRIGLVSLPSIEGDPERVHQAVLAQAGGGAEIVFIDALTNTHLDLIGGALGSLAPADRPVEPPWQPTSPPFRRSPPPFPPAPCSSCPAAARRSPVGRSITLWPTASPAWPSTPRRPTPRPSANKLWPPCAPAAR